MSTLAVAAAIETGWFIAYAVTLLVTWPRRPRQRSADPGLPAFLQVMLARRVKAWVEPAVDATFADLMRRGWFESSGHTVRLTTGDDRQLTAAEQDIYTHVSTVVGKNPDGTAPLAALNEGHGPSTKWAAFQKAAETEALSRGLIRHRLPTPLKMLLIVSGLAAPLFYVLSIEDKPGPLIAMFILGGLIYWWIVAESLGGHVLTAAGAQIAGPVPHAGFANGSPLTAPRDDNTGWVYDGSTGWRRWRVAEDSFITFSRWPDRLVWIAAIGWAIVLIGTVSMTDRFDFGDLFLPALGAYLGTFAVRGLIGLSRAIRMRLKQREFERGRSEVTGTAVRKFTHTYDAPGGDGSTRRTDHYIVVDTGAGQYARKFIVPEHTYDTVHEGRTVVRALPAWQTHYPDAFEVLQP